jgi:cell division protein FtsB
MAESDGIDAKESEPLVNRVQKCILAGAAIALLHLMLLVVFGDNGVVELFRLRNQKQVIADQNDQLARQNVYLYRTIGRLKNDPVFIESVARNELGMVGKQDVIVRCIGQREQNR